MDNDEAFALGITAFFHELEDPEYRPLCPDYCNRLWWGKGYNRAAEYYELNRCKIYGLQPR